MSESPAVPYWRLWVDGDGVSHQRREEVLGFHLTSISPPAAPQWLGAEAKAEAVVRFTILPVGWVGEWHPNPHPQWILPLSGRWFVESMDGQRVEMGPGELSFGDDGAARARDGRVGHRSGTVGDAPASLMLVQFPRGGAGPLG